MSLTPSPMERPMRPLERLVFLLRSAWFIARKDVMFLLRQKETLLWVFVMPGVFFYFIGTITGGFGSPAGSQDRPDLLALKAPAESGFLFDELVRRLEEQNFSVVRPQTEEEFEGYSRRLTVPSPKGDHQSFTESVLAADPVALSFSRRGDDLAADFDRLRVNRAVYAVLADLAVTVQDDAGPGPESFRSLAAQPRSLTLRVETAGRREDPPSGYAQAVPGTIVMFTMLVLLTSGAILLVIEREEGLLRRLASTPISPGAVVLGKWTGRMALGIVQIGVGVGVGILFFRMDWGQALPMVVLVLFAWAAANASGAILLASLARTNGQMAGLGVVSTMLLAALGGCWWPIEIAPAWMQSLALWLPTGWTMDALHKLVAFGYEASVAWPHVLGLSTLALVLGWMGARVFRYQ